ncbi:MAG: hypothetical protein IKB16_10980 [Lentisphaeria bacterium]|nr:hypothetical protein [Lentisphaeria bacterium]
MQLQQDLHLHTHCSCDSACAQIDAIVKGCQAAGIKHFGISDHLHTKFNMPDIEIARKEFLEYGPVPGFHFGIEVSCATQWECEKIAKRDYASCFTCEVNGKKFQTMTPIDGIMYGGPANGPLMVDLTQEDIDRLGIEYVIGGVHKPNYTEQTIPTMIDDYFNQHCYLVKHELVDVLAHPWDGLGFWSGYNIVTHDPADYRVDAFEKIPQEYWDELAHLLLTHNKLAELNFGTICSRRFEGKIARYTIEKLAEWRDKGVKFTYGSDLHGAKYPLDGEVTIYDAMKCLTEYGFTEADFALPPRLK